MDGFRSERNWDQWRSPPPLLGSTVTIIYQQRFNRSRHPN